MSGVSESKNENSAFTINRLLLKIKYSFYSTLVFFLFANPETFKVLNQILGKFVHITESSGIPTTVGFFLSTTLFFVTMLGLMLLPSI
jgi:hypothetical protein